MEWSVGSLTLLLCDVREMSSLSEPKFLPL